MNNFNTHFYEYWRSSAAFRVRIALNLAGLDYQSIDVDLIGREHQKESYYAINPQGLVPSLGIDGHNLTQSLAIIEYLDETRDLGLLPKNSHDRWRVRAMSYCIAMEIHPICNLSVAGYVYEITNKTLSRRDWMHEFIPKGLRAFEGYLEQSKTGKYCHGETITMADLCLYPQIYNANRWGVDLEKYPQIIRIVNQLDKLDEFQRAHPDNLKGKEV